LLTTRGYLSRGNSFAMVANGGAGDDSFQVYSNQADLTLNGDDGNDTFTIRAFALQAGGYNLNAHVTINGGAGFDQVIVIGTELDDNFALMAQAIFGAGLHVAHDTIESVEVDGLEGNDTFFLLSTRAGVTTTIVGNSGSDTLDVTGDVTLPIIQGLDPTPLQDATHTTIQIQRPVDFEGFNGPRPIPPIATAIILPTEMDPGPFAFPAPPADDHLGIDRITVFNDRSITADTGTLTGTNLSGVNMASALTLNEGTDQQPNLVTIPGGLTY